MEVSSLRRRKVVENGLVAIFCIIMASMNLVPGETSTFRLICGGILLLIAAFRILVAVRAARN